MDLTKELQIENVFISEVEEMVHELMSEMCNLGNQNSRQYLLGHRKPANG